MLFMSSIHVMKFVHLQYPILAISYHISMTIPFKTMHLKLIGLSFGVEQWSVGNNFFGKKTLKTLKDVSENRKQPPCSKTV